MEDGPRLTDGGRTDGWVRLSVQALHSTNLRGAHQKIEDTLNL